jgi:hypothetical protein
VAGPDPGGDTDGAVRHVVAHWVVHEAGRRPLGEPGIAQGRAVTYQALGGHAGGQQPAWRVGHDGAMTEDEKR